MTVAAAAQPGLLHLGEAGITAGVALFLWGVRIDGKPWWDRFRRRVLYISSVSERLPENGPSTPFRCYWISETDVPGIKWEWTEQTGTINYPSAVRPKCQRIEVTNHSDGTLVNVTVVIELQSFGKPGEPPLLEQYKMEVEFDQIGAGGTGTAFVVNDSSMTIVGRPIRARGTQIGGKPHELGFHTKSFPSITFFSAERFLPRPVSKVPSALGITSLENRLSSGEWISTVEVAAEQLDQTRTEHRRALIEDCRDIVQQYRDAGLPEPFGEYVVKQRPYLDIQPHLGAEYLQSKAKQAERPDTPTQRDWDSGEFLREVARQEKKWDL